MIPLADSENRPYHAPVVTPLLIVVNVVVFLYQLSLSDRALEGFFRSAGVIPLEYATGRDVPPGPPLGILYVTLLTSMFMHGGWLHIGSNMLYLWVFGDNVEDRMGKANYLVFYLLCGLLASAAHIVTNLGSPIPSIGASGAIAGVLASYFVMFGQARIRTLLFLGPFITMTRLPAVFLIGFWFVTQLLAGLVSLGESAQTSGVAVWAHVGGFAAGFVLTPLFRSRAPAPSRL